MSNFKAPSMVRQTKEQRAISKKQRAEALALSENAKRDQAMELAMRRTPKVVPDLPPPASSSGLTRGWHFSDYGDGQVVKCCSSSIHYGWDSWECTTTRGTRWLYSTELLAYKALRHAQAENFAAILAVLDAKIRAMEASE